MTYSPETSKGHEAAKIASIAVPYLQGRFLDLGAGNDPVWPSAIAFDNYQTFGSNSTGIRGDIRDLSLFTDASFDAVFSSHALEDLAPSEVAPTLREWARVLKVGGYMVLYVPSANLYPKCGTENANHRHMWDIYPGAIERIMRAKVSDPHEWELVESEERNGTNEYSLFIVMRKLAQGVKGFDNVWQRNPDGKQRALVIRYGAYGDSIQTSSIFPLLKAQGYHVTVNCKPESHTILKHDPYVDAWITQEQDYVPNHQLGPYWESLYERYDRVINLCESIEGALLTLPGRLQHKYPDDIRRSMFGTVNYQERIHQLAGVSCDPADFNPRFFMSDYELRWAKALRRAYTDDATPIITWGIGGSSIHKIYPYPQVVIKWLLEQTNFHIVLLGDEEGRKLQDGLLLPELEADGLDMTRVHPMCGMWKIRESLSFAMVSDVVVGPETGILNAVSHEESIAKVVYLSHSSETNLTKHWKNTIALSPPVEQAPCFPCHRLHFDWTHCHRSEKTLAALCASNISPESVFKAIAQSVGVQL